jgi:glycosyltransferase involved in cell wall biosynthesis
MTAELSKAYTDFIEKVEQRHASGSQPFGKRILGPTIQHSGLGVHGGLGDFVLQTSQIFPQIEWCLPLTQKIQKKLNLDLAHPLLKIPVSLYEPVTGERYSLEVDVFAHMADNGSVSWIFHQPELFAAEGILRDLAVQETAWRKSHSTRTKGEVAADPVTLHAYSGLIDTNGYGGLLPSLYRQWRPKWLSSINRLHPLLRRYADTPHVMNAILQGAVAKAIVNFAGLTKRHDVFWVQDWHFATIAGELLLPEYRRESARMEYVQHLHNALYQGIFPQHELIDVLGWPRSFLKKNLFCVHGQVNFLGGALNALRNGYVKGKAVAVSENHARELTTPERGAGLHHIFASLYRKQLLTGVNNPIVKPKNLVIHSSDELPVKKPALKAEAQKYFGFEEDPEAFLVLWSHRFIHQKQVHAVLEALDAIFRENPRPNVQVAFFCDVHSGSRPEDVKRLFELIELYPQHIALRAFEPSMEMPLAAGVDGALMASFFEPFGYAPVWVAMQGGLVITGANGGQIDIFDREQTVLIDILPDIDDPVKRYSVDWFLKPRKWPEKPNAYRNRVFHHNREAVRAGVLEAVDRYRNPLLKEKGSCTNMTRIKGLVESGAFEKRISKHVFGVRGAPDRKPLENHSRA